MRFSTFHTPITPGPEYDTQVIDALLERIQIADEGGFACIYGPEHHFDDYTAYGNNFVLMPYLAGQLTQAYVGFSICVVPMHHPARLAEMANLLDQLAKGKFIFGLGGGGIPLESAGFGLETADQADLHDEVFEVVMQLWDKKPEDPPIDFEVRDLYRGKLVQRIMPRAYRPEGPIIKLAGVSPDRIDKAAKYGWAAFAFPPMLPVLKQKYVEYGHSPETIERALQWTSAGGNVHVAETDEQARAELRTALVDRARWVGEQKALEEQHINSWMHLKPGMVAPAYDSDEYLDRVIHGSPETVIEKLKPFADMGFSEYVMELDLSISTPERQENTKRAFQLFADEIVPFFDNYEPDAEAGEVALKEMQERMAAMFGGPPPGADAEPESADA